MASRNQRRKRAEARRREPDVTGEGGVAPLVRGGVVKSEASRQIAEPIDDGFADLYAADKAVQPPYPLEKLLELSELSAVHSACIDAKVADTCGRGWYLEREEGDAVADEQASREAELRQWLRERCPRMPFQQMVDQLAREQEAAGWGVWEVVRAADGTIDSLYPLPAHTLRAVKGDPDAFVQVRGRDTTFFKRFGVEKRLDAKTGRWDDGADGDAAASEVLIFKLYTPRSDYYGIPRWISVVPALGELAAIREYNVAWFSSGGKGDRVIHVTDEEASGAKPIADNIADQLKKVRTKPGHASVVSWGGKNTGVSVHDLSAGKGKGGKDSDFKEGRGDLLNEVLIGHQVPPYRVGLAEVGSLAGNAAKEMLAAYRFGTIEPPQETLEDLLAATIFNAAQGGYDLDGWRLRFADVDWEELERDVAAAAEAVEAGLLTPNEGRTLIGKPTDPDPAADRLYRQGVPLTGLEQDAREGAVQEAVKVLREFREELRSVVEKDEQPRRGRLRPRG